MGVKAASESALAVAFHDLVFDVGLKSLVQVVEDHSGEKACDTGADDANFEVGTFLLLGWSWRAVDDRGLDDRGLDDRSKLIATLWCWLRERKQDLTSWLLRGFLPMIGCPSEFPSIVRELRCWPFAHRGRFGQFEIQRSKT